MLPIPIWLAGVRVNADRPDDTGAMTKAVSMPLMRRIARLVVSVLKIFGFVGILVTLWFSIGLEWELSPKHLWIDKDRHFLAFYTLASVALIALINWSRWEIIICLLMLAGGIEIIQPYFGRERSVMDFMADCVGILLAYLPVLLWRMRHVLRQYS
jgi:VanZ family protein